MGNPLEQKLRRLEKKIGRKVKKTLAHGIAKGASKVAGGVAGIAGKKAAIKVRSSINKDKLEKAVAKGLGDAAGKLHQAVKKAVVTAAKV